MRCTQGSRQPVQFKIWLPPRLPYPPLVSLKFEALNGPLFGDPRGIRSQLAPSPVYYDSSSVGLAADEACSILFSTMFGWPLGYGLLSYVPPLFFDLYVPASKTWFELGRFGCRSTSHGLFRTTH